jgi:hypothetical protein
LFFPIFQVWFDLKEESVFTLKNDYLQQACLCAWEGEAAAWGAGGGCEA